MELQNIQNFSLNSVNVSGVVAGYSSVLDTVDLDMLLSTLQDLQTVSCRVQLAFINEYLSENDSRYTPVYMNVIILVRE